jgi:hypothetical protein
MNERRNFLKMATAAAAPVGIAMLTAGVAGADDGSVKEFLGCWSMLHDGPEGEFREFLCFADGGVVTESNSFLHTASNYNFAGFGIPGVLRASDGFGNWERVANGVIRVSFRKMIFDITGKYLSVDLRARGDLKSDGKRLFNDPAEPWVVEVVTASDVDRPDVPSMIIRELARANSRGVRIR